MKKNVIRREVKYHIKQKLEKGQWTREEKNNCPSTTVVKTEPLWVKGIIQSELGRINKQNDRTWIQYNSAQV